MRLRGCAFSLLCCLGLVACDSAGTSKCESLTKKLIDRIKTECSISKPGCGGNPDLDRPVTMFTKFHKEAIDEIIVRDCPAPNLGVAPLLCDTAGSPGCPEGYQCCAVGGEDQCRSDCRDGGVGPDVGPRPDRGAADGATDAGASAE